MLLLYVVNKLYIGLFFNIFTWCQKWGKRKAKNDEEKIQLKPSTRTMNKRKKSCI